MATTTQKTSGTRRSNGTTRSTAARRTGAASRSTVARKTTATNRSTGAKKATATRRRAQVKRSTAAQRAAATRALNARTPVQQVQETAEKAVLIPVGAALVARDRVVEAVSNLVDTYGTRATAQRRIESNLKKFERRGTTARNKLERDAKRTRTRVERTVRQNRKRLQREVKATRKDVGARVDLVSAQVENAVQNGITASTKAVARSTETASAIS